jgi:hypothetical protein
MSLTLSQTFVVVGLAFEFISVLWTVRKLFYGYYQRLDEKGLSTQTRIKKDKREGIIVLTFLTIGMFLQGIAVFM